MGGVTTTLTQLMHAVPWSCGVAVATGALVLLGANVGVGCAVLVAVG